MSSQDHHMQQLSELIDGELDGHVRAGLLKRLAEEPELRARWKRYHLVSDVIRNNTPQFIGKDFASRVSQALESEPAILAPHPQPVKEGLLKKAAGFAVAASVAVFGILGGQQFMQNGAVMTASNGTSQVAELSRQPQVVSLLTVPVSATEHTSTSNDPYMNRYLINHSVHAQRAGMYGVLPAARIVGYQQER